MTTIAHPKNPYVGPRPFQIGETLYGRDREILEILDLLIAERIVLVYSPSGAGKTSLIQAGLLPALEEEGFVPLPVMRVSLEPPFEQRADLPASYNRYVLSAILALEEGVPEDRQLPLAELAGLTLAEYLSGSAGIENAAASLPAPGSAGILPASSADRMSALPGRIVLIFDQFEEILTIDPTDHEVKTEFFAQVAAVLRHPDRWALFAMREEFPAQLDPYLRHFPTRLSTTFRLALLDVEAACRAIQEPVRQAGMLFTDGAAKELADDLRQIRVQQPDGTTEERLGQYIEPVQLQVVCYRLWNQLPEDITEIGEDDIQEARDVDTALAGYYADRVKMIAQETGIREQTIREWFLHHLITEQGIRGQVVREPEQTHGLANQSIDLLVDALLVRAENHRGITWYELAHDRLIEPIQFDNFDWFQEHLSLLQREAALWELQARATGLLLRDEVLKEAEQWAADHQNELTATEQEFLAASQVAQAQLQRERQYNLLIRGLAVVATIVMCVALFFYVKAEDRRKDAERLSFVSLAQNLMNAAIHQQHDDVRVLLARQAYLFNQRGHGTVLADVDRVLRAGLSASSFSQALHLDTEVMAVAVSPDGQFLAFGSGDGSVQVYSPHQSNSAPLLFRGHKGPVCSVAFSPDGGQLASSGWDSTIRIWNMQAPDSAPAILEGHQKAVFSVAFSPDGHTLASGSWDQTLRLWDLQDIQAVPRVLSGHEGGINSVAFSPDGNTVASGSSDGTIRLWNWQHPDLQVRILRFSEKVSPARPQPPGSISRDRPGSAPSGRLGKPDRQPSPPAQDATPGPDASPPPAGINAIAFSLDGQTLAAGGSDKTIRLWNVDKPNHPSVSLKGHTEDVLTLAFSPDGETLASGSWDQTLRLWNLRSPDKASVVLRGHKELIFSVAFDPNGEQIVSGSGDHTVRLWDLKPSEVTAVVTLRASEARPKLSLQQWQSVAVPRAIKTLLFHQDKLLAVNEESFVRAYDAESPEAALNLLDTHKHKATAVAVNSNSNMLAIGGDQGTISLWKMDNLEAPPLVLEGHTGMINTLAFSTEGTSLASGGEDKTIRIWDMDDLDEPPLVLGAHKGAILSLAFNPQKMLLASGGADGVIRLWNLRLSEYPSLVLPHNDTAIPSLAFSPDGAILASGADNGEIRLWNLRNLRTDLAWLITFGFDFTPLPGHENSISTLTFSPDGTTLASASQSMIHIWDLQNFEAVPIKLGESLQPRQALLPDQDRETPDSNNQTAQSARAESPLPSDGDAGRQSPVIQTLAFSPDGKYLASGSHEGTIQIWTTPAFLAEEVCKKVWRNLTLEEWQQFVGKGIPYEQTCPEQE